MSHPRLSRRRRAMIAVGSSLLATVLGATSVAAQTSRSAGLNTVVISGATRCFTGQNAFTRERFKQINVESPVIRSTVMPARFSHAYWTVTLIAISENGTVSHLSTRSTYGYWQSTAAGRQYTFLGKLGSLSLTPATWRGTILMQETIQLTNSAGTPLAGGTTTVWEDEYFTDTDSYPTNWTSEAGYCVFR